MVLVIQLSNKWAYFQKCIPYVCVSVNAIIPQFIFEPVLTNLTSFPSPFSLPVPPSYAELMAVPDESGIYEGDDLYLLCRADGTPPVTFKWYHVGNNLPLYTNTSNDYSSSYQVPSVSKEHNGRYYCEAFNHVNKVVRSEEVTIEGENDGYLCMVGTHLLQTFCSVTDADLWLFYLWDMHKK